MTALLMVLLAGLSATALLGWAGAARRAAWLKARLDVLDRLDLQTACGCAHDRPRGGKVIPLFSVRDGTVTHVGQPPKGAA